MTSRRPRPTGSSGNASAAEAKEAAPENGHHAEADSPILQEGVGMPGRRLEPFAPERYYATFRCDPGDGGEVDEDLFLTEENLPRVEGRGIRLGNRWYWDDSEQLARLITGPAGAPKRTLRIRYDRALLAAGVLEEVFVVEVVDGGRRVPRVRCRLRDRVLEEVNPMEHLKWRREYERRLRNDRRLGQEALLALQAGSEAVARLHEETAAQRRKRSTKQRGPATPVILDTPADARRKKAKKRQEALGAASRTTESTGSDTDTKDDTRQKSSGQRGRTRKRGESGSARATRGQARSTRASHPAQTTSDGAAAPRSTDLGAETATSSSARQPKSLGTVLGGQLGWG
jgi:hypothetical protein